MSQLLKILCFLVLAGLVSATPVQGVVYDYWQGGSGGGCLAGDDFALNANWVDNTAPTAADSPVIDNGGTAVVCAAYPTNVDKLYVGTDVSGTAGNGTLNVVSGGSLATSSASYLGHGVGTEGTINIQAGGSLTSTSSFCIGSGSTSKGTLNVTGGTYTGNSYFYPGQATGSVGIVNLSAGLISVDTSSDEIRMGNGSNSVGVINQTGGTLNNTQDYTYLGYSSGSYAYYRLGGGNANLKSLRIGNTGSAGGVFEQSGGTLDIASSTYVGFRAGISGVYNLTGGTASVNSALVCGGYDGSWGQLNVGSSLSITATDKYLVVGSSGTGGATAYCNLNTGGTLTAPTVLSRADISAGTGSLGGFFNFHGGTLKANASTADPGDSETHFMRLRAEDGGIFVGTEGGTIDTNGYDIVISEPLQCMTGCGVTGIGLTDGGSGYYGPPIVQLSGGGGWGATAIANMVDDGTGQGTLEIGSFTVTNPGAGYDCGDTLAVALLDGGYDTNTPATLGAVTLAANGQDGGLTVLDGVGGGKLTVAGTNTYTGLTDVQAGTLAITGTVAGDVDVHTGATLMGGSGQVAGDVDLNPDVNPGGTLGVEYNSDDDTIRLLEVAGDLDVTGGTFNFTDAGTGELAVGDYVFATYGDLFGNPASHMGLQPGWSVDYLYDYDGGTDNAIALIVPEPSMLVLLVGFLMGVLLVRRRS